MKYVNFLAILKFLVLLSSCSSKQGNAKLSSYSTPESIVFIFKNHPKIIDKLSLSSGMYYQTFSPEVFYYDDFSNNEFYLGENEVADTITIRPKSEYIIVRHRLDAVNYYEYLFNRGDTVLFEYRAKKPFPVVLNRKTLPYDLIYDHECSKLFYTDFVARGYKYFRPDLFVDYSKAKENDILKQESNIRQNEYRETVSNFANEHKLLDSLINNKLLSPIVYQFYDNRIENLSLLLEIKEEKLKVDRIVTITKTGKLASSDFPNLYYHLLLEGVSDNLLASRVRNIDFKDGFNKDYRELYYLIDSSTMFSPEGKNYLLTREINRIAKSFPKNTFQKYFKSYEQTVKDTAMVNYTRRKNFLLIDNNSSIDNGSISLLNIEKQPISFDDFKMKNKGKIIYIDFWASWCMPCRAAMPSSLKLRASFEGKDVVFLYLSLDKDFEAWKKAATVDGINKYANSYIITNLENSEFIKKNKIAEIPRYMIFDKNGNLIQSNAMGPANKELPNILVNLLN